MRPLIAPDIMLKSERECFESGIVSSIEMMERAATALADAVIRYYPDAENVNIVCGPGGNGGDGYACARLLKAKGVHCTLIPLSASRHTDAITNEKAATDAGISFADPHDSVSEPDLWIDCLFGTGLARCPEGISADLITRMNASSAPVLAADIPSGLNGRTGKAYAACVRADRTVTFQYGKYGHFLEDGLDVCGELTIADIGFDQAFFPHDLPVLFEAEDIASHLPVRKRNLHKGTCGHLLIIAGSLGMAGAAALCAKAALRSGVGLVTIACPKDIVPILQTLVPCAMCVALPSSDGIISDEATDILPSLFPGKSAVVAGCGWSRAVPRSVLRCVLNSSLPAVIDADALNLLSANTDLFSLLRKDHILTPHIGEAARLLGTGITDPVRDAHSLAALGATVVLKSASRIITDGVKTMVSASGGCGMARGGSGDIFSGILGALLADRSVRTPAESAAVACELHGLSGLAAQKCYGSRSMNSADILEFLPEVFMHYANC